MVWVQISTRLTLRDHYGVKYNNKHLLKGLGPWLKETDSDCEFVTGKHARLKKNAVAYR